MEAPPLKFKNILWFAWETIMATNWFLFLKISRNSTMWKDQPSCKSSVNMLSNVAWSTEKLLIFLYQRDCSNAKAVVPSYIRNFRNCWHHSIHITCPIIWKLYSSIKIMTSPLRLTFTYDELIGKVLIDIIHIFFFFFQSQLPLLFSSLPVVLCIAWGWYLVWIALHSCHEKIHP